jgi:hypothetical protein
MYDFISIYQNKNTNTNIQIREYRPVLHVNSVFYNMLKYLLIYIFFHRKKMHSIIIIVKIAPIIHVYTQQKQTVNCHIDNLLTSAPILFNYTASDGVYSQEF